MEFRIRNRRFSRSWGGDLAIFLLLGAGAAFMALPLVYVVCSAFKPLNELFLFPPRFFVRNPTLDNFKDLLILMRDSWVPFTRYAFNSLLVVSLGTGGHILFASMGAFAVTKYKFPGNKLFSTMVMLSLMFAPQVTAIPGYMVMSRLGWINSYASMIIPAWGMSLGFYLMSKFMDAMVPDSLLEAAKIDGASDFMVYWRIVMPIVRPAWLTLIILSFQQLWADEGSRFIYKEELKTLPYALNQIAAGGVARWGVASAVALILVIIPVVLFVFNQSKIVQTMATSGIEHE